jgi:phage I-like protein
LLVLTKRVALPDELRAVRPKTLRFRLFNLPGRLVHHARGWVLKLWRGMPLAEALVQGRERLAALAEQQRAPRKVAAPA